MDCTVLRSLYRWVLHSTGCFYVLRFYFYVCLLILLGACVGRHDKLVFALLFFISTTDSGEDEELLHRLVFFKFSFNAC